MAKLRGTRPDPDEEARKLEEERKRLLEQVKRMEEEARQLSSRWDSSRSIPTTSPGTIKFTPLMDPLSYDQYQRMLGVNATSISFLPPKPSPKQQQGAWFEVKVWHEDGRYEVVRGYSETDPLDIATGAGVVRTDGPQRKVVEGDTVALRGRARAWSRGPDGRPKT